jgi:hypothetical protein
MARLRFLTLMLALSGLPEISPVHAASVCFGSSERSPDPEIREAFRQSNPVFSPDYQKKPEKNASLNRKALQWLAENTTLSGQNKVDLYVEFAAKVFVVTKGYWRTKLITRPDSWIFYGDIGEFVLITPKGDLYTGHFSQSFNLPGFPPSESEVEEVVKKLRDPNFPFSPDDSGSYLTRRSPR